jgi:hypothetical protein
LKCEFQKLGQTSFRRGDIFLRGTTIAITLLAIPLTVAARRCRTRLLIRLLYRCHVLLAQSGIPSQSIGTLSQQLTARAVDYSRSGLRAAQVAFLSGEGKSDA